MEYSAKKTSVRILPVWVAVAAVLIAGSQGAFTDPARAASMQLSLNKPSYTTGDTVAYTVNSAEPDTPLYVTLIRDGWYIGKDVASAQKTGSDGSVTVSSSQPFSLGEGGTYELTVKVGTQQQSVPFTVSDSRSQTLPEQYQAFETGFSVAALFAVFSNLNLASTSPAEFPVISDRASYSLGQIPIFSLSGLKSNAEISAFPFVNGRSVGPVLLGTAKTDAAGGWTGSLMASGLAQGHVGHHMVLFSVEGSGIGMAQYSVGDVGVSPIQRLPAGEVGKSYSGSVQAALPQARAGVAYSLSYYLLSDGLVPAGTYEKQVATQSTSTQLSIDRYVVRGVQPQGGAVTVGVSGMPVKAEDDGAFIVLADDGSNLVDGQFFRLAIGGSTGTGSPATVSGPSTGLRYDDIAPGGGGLRFPQANRLLKAPGSPTVYFVNGRGEKLAVPSMKVLTGYGRRSEEIETVFSDDLSAIPDIRYIRAGDSQVVYQLDGSTKRRLYPAAAERLAVDPASVQIVSRTHLNAYRTGPSVRN